MPCIVAALFVAFLHRTPCDLMGDFFTTFTTTTIFGVLILIPRTIKGFFIDILSMSRQYMFDTFRKLGRVIIWHYCILLTIAMIATLRVPCYEKYYDFSSVTTRSTPSTLTVAS